MWINSFLLPLVLTIFIEGAAAFLLGHRDRQTLQMVTIVNVVTNPFMNLISLLLAYYGLGRFFYWFILPLELLLIPVEWLILSYAMPHKKKELLKLSAVMNSISFVIGLLIF
ncbi:MAG TPA: hypothetical protein VEF53_05295 [Patescibacteria group bacterium]|nr:hypothetical protein [Patescibacteria group bacterium]